LPLAQSGQAHVHTNPADAIENEPTGAVFTGQGSGGATLGIGAAVAQDGFPSPALGTLAGLLGALAFAGLSWRLRRYLPGYVRA
jgi:hypothetical protein